MFILVGCELTAQTTEMLHECPESPREAVQVRQQQTGQTRQRWRESRQGRAISVNVCVWEMRMRGKVALLSCRRCEYEAGQPNACLTCIYSYLCVNASSSTQSKIFSQINYFHSRGISILFEGLIV